MLITLQGLDFREIAEDAITERPYPQKYPFFSRHENTFIQ